MNRISTFLRDKIFRTWILCYLVILIIAGTILSSGYFFLVDRYEKEIQHSNNLTLKHIQLLTENMLVEASSLADNLTSNKDLKTLAHAQSLSDQGTLVMLELCDNFRSHPLLNSGVVSFHVYLPKLEYIVASSFATDSHTAIDVISEEYFTNEETYLKIISAYQKGEFLPLSSPSLGPSHYLGYFKTLYYDTNVSPTATVAVVINTKKLLQTINSALQTKNGSVLIYDDENNLIFSTTENVSSGEGMFVSSIKSSFNDWTYKSITPRSVLFKQFIHIRNYVVIAFFLALLAGLILSFCFTLKNYTPIVEIQNIIHSSSKAYPCKKDDSLSFIKSAFISEIQTKDSMKQTLESQTMLLRNSFFTQLYSGHFDNNNNLSEIFGYFSLPPIYDCFCVSTFFLDDLADFSHENQPFEKNISLANYAIKNILTELLPTKFQCILSEIDGTVIALFGLSEKTDRNSLITFLNNLKNTLESLLFISVSISCSNCYTAPNGYKSAYNEAVSFILHSKLNTSDSVISSKPQNETSFKFSEESQSHLLNYIKLGDIESATSAVSHLLNHAVSNDLSRYYVTELIRKIAKTLFSLTENQTSENITSSFMSLFFSNSIKTKYDFMFMEKHLYNLVKEMCHYYVYKSHKQTSHNTLGDKIKSFIDSNYSDIRLSVVFIAEHFNLSRNHIAKIFKEETSYSINDYINYVRIEKSKEFLKDENLTIIKISEMCGYISDNTFTRIFKKIEGIPPGQYRSIINNN